ncbi:DUF1707 SHOCT-like domain-containing protein [Blastococcus goldschmidtiae]|uniref:DUF1707 domain-containing protein n=1 Tax=Blastococcus goldschmidtiae TaxID=3075546 RepID=A0ABU2K2R2_9ACTN|nr:DUF1707 domain-containing protein [Blastococcus sp. DSM 46792]MDT0274371.1 DUF1707 domain-containing protein [Blastococcus sp. DSM 46792]
MPEPHLRAADADRTAVAGVLGEHMSAGRLTVAEYEERLTRAYAARTYGELAELTTDLPDGRATSAGSVAGPARWRADWSEADAWAWRSWASTAAIVVSIWAITSVATWQFLYFWPIWVIGPWGVVLFIQSFAGDGEDDEEEPGPRSLPGR